MFKKGIIIFLLLFGGELALSESTPEVKDEIYTDLIQELDVATKSLESEEKNLEKLQNELLNVVPQTGQIKYAQKRVEETSATVNKLKQQKLFFEIKIEQRKIYIRDRFKESLTKGGRSWPDKKEIEDYRAIMKLQRDKLDWEKNKGIKKDVPHGTQKTEPPKSEH